MSRDGGMDGAVDAGADAGIRSADAEPATDAGIGRPDADDAIDATSSCGTGLALRGAPPNVLIVLPRACQMLYPWRSDTGSLYMPTDPASVWAEAMNGIHQFIERYPGRIRWGLLTYPTLEGAVPRCAVPPIAVEPQDGGGAMVLAALSRSELAPSYSVCTTDGREFGGGPPMLAALDAARGSTALHDPTRNNFVLLLSAPINDHCFDPTLTRSQAESERVARALLAEGIRTITLSPSQNTPSEMEWIARAGGFPLPEPGTAFTGTDFYSLPFADTVEHLVSAITRATFSCTSALSGRPPDAAALHVYADDALLTRDPSHHEGWDYDASANAVTLYGSPCDAAIRGETSRLSATHGCATPTCTPDEEVCDGLDNDCDALVDEARDCTLI